MYDMVPQIQCIGLKLKRLKQIVYYFGPRWKGQKFGKFYVVLGIFYEFDHKF
jgi:hypothetical protein